MLNFHRFAIDWLSLNFSESAEKASKRANKTGVFTRISMGRLFSGVPPSKALFSTGAKIGFLINSGKMKVGFCLIYVNFDLY